MKERETNSSRFIIKNSEKIELKDNFKYLKYKYKRYKIMQINAFVAINSNINSD